MKRKNLLKIVTLMMVISCATTIGILARTDCYTQSLEEQVQQEIQFLLDNPQYCVGVDNSANTLEEECATPEQWEAMVAAGMVGDVTIEHYNQTHGISDDSTATTAESTSGGSTSTTTGTSASANTAATEEEEKETVTVDESVSGTYIATSDAVVYSDYETAEETGSLSTGKEYTVSGLTSNGYYVVVYAETEGYVSANDVVLITEEEYDNAWVEAVVTEPTCTEDGSISYLNTYTNETKIEETEATGHDDGEWTTVEKATLFSDGSEELRCTKCDTILETKTTEACIKDYYAIILVGVVIVASVIFLVVKQLKKSK